MTGGRFRSFPGRQRSRHTSAIGRLHRARPTARRRKGPVALLHYPSVLVAVFSAALLAALAASSSPFVTTAVASEALKNRLAELTPFATGLKISSESPPASVVALTRAAGVRAAAARTLAASLGGVGEPVFTTESDTIYVLGAGGDTPVRLMSRTNALQHVKILSRVPGSGVWISTITAETGRLKAGGMLRLDTAIFGARRHVSLRIKGVYRALAQSPPTAYWENFSSDIYPRTPNDSPPPSYVFLSRAALFRAVPRPARRFGFGPRSGGGTLEVVELPVEPRGMTLAAARALDRRFERFERRLHVSALGRHLGCGSRLQQGQCDAITSLSSAVILAERNARAVTVPVALLSDLGTAIALGVAAAAGAFQVRRRRVEAALVYTRGEHVAAYAAQSAVEALAPLLAGGVAGFGLAYALTSVFAPAGSTDPATVWAGAAHATIATAIALVLLVATASLAFLRLFDTGARSHPWLRRIPWELPVLAAAAYLFVEIETGGGMSGGASGATHPTPAVFVFPLVLVAGTAGLAARLARFLLGRVGNRGARRPAVYLALRRLAAARGLLILLAVVSAVALGAFCYAGTLAASLGHTTIEKAYMATGSDAQAEILNDEPLPASFPYPITRVVFGNQAASIDSADGTQVDVMLVDPKTIESALHWESDWGANPGGLLRLLGSSAASPLPVIVTPEAAGMRRLSILGRGFPVHILGTVSAFPGMATGIPLVITSESALNEVTSRAKIYGPLGIVQTYVWGKGPPLEVERALTASTALGAYYPSSIETFLHDPNVVLATRTFSFMRTIALAAAALVLLGLLLYLQARRRTQVIASALARRMGLGAGAEALSLTLELGGILLFAAVAGGAVALAAARPVTRHIDPLPEDAPSPIFTVPTGELLIATGVLVVVAVLAGILTSRLARRADVSEALRVA